MSSLRRHHQAFVRLALVAMLVLSCVPTLSRWLAAAQGPLAWAEICAPQGIRSPLVAADAAAGQAAVHLDACDYCTLASGAAPPPVGAVEWRAAAPADGLPPCRPQTDAARAEWAAAQARAPPALS